MKTKRGLTLFELLVAVGITALLMGSITLVYLRCFNVFNASQDRSQIKSELSQTMELLGHELSEALSITSCFGTSLSFITSAGTVTYALKTGVLVRNSNALKASNISSSSIFSCTNGLVSIDITATYNSEVFRFHSKVRPRNMPVGLVGWWKLDETAGASAADSSGHFNSGSLINTPTLNVASVHANLGTAMTFNGTNEHINLSTPSQVGLTQYTIMCWFNRAGNGANANTGATGLTGATLSEPLVTKLVNEGADGSNTDGNYFLGIAYASTNPVSVFPPHRRLAADFEDNATGTNHPVLGNGASGLTISNGTWYHAAVTFDGTNEILYLNGILEGTAAQAFTPRSDSIQKLAIGTTINSTGTASGRFKGSIDDVRIYNRALSAKEILQINDRGRGTY
jgi:hypothetical protein